MTGQGHGEKKSRKQELFVAALLTYPSVEAAAKAVGISTASALRWRKAEDFIAMYREARREVMRQTSSLLQHASREAVETLRTIQSDGESESARVSAARCILEQSMKAADLEDIQERLDAVERLVQIKKRNEK